MPSRAYTLQEASMLFDHRRRWGASSTSPAGQLLRARGVKVHWLGTPYASRSHSQCLSYVRGIRDAHVSHPTENWIDVAYNLFACEHGHVIEGRGAGRRSGANGTAALNTRHYAVCALHGTDSGQPSHLLLNALHDAITYLQKRGAGTEVSYHGKDHPTKCPGPDLTAWVKSGARRQEKSEKVHRVCRGENLTYLAQKYRTTVNQFVELNKLKNPDIIRVGQRLVVPTYEPPPFPRGIGPGNRIPSAKGLQRVMKDLGFMDLSVPYADNYGPRTADAVAAFHNRYTQFRFQGVDRDVKIGPKGWEFAHRKAYGNE